MTDVLSEVPEDVRGDASAWIERVIEEPFRHGDEQPAWAPEHDDEEHR